MNAMIVLYNIPPRGTVPEVKAPPGLKPRKGDT
jgi:hypothetical protein